MSQDIISDTLNQMMNVKKAGKSEVVVNRYSKVLINLLDIVKKIGYLEYKIEGRKLRIKINNNLNEFKAIKPRYSVSVDKINKYVRRFLPARDFGFVIISTNKGMMLHQEAEEKNIGGCLIAYIF